MTTLYAVDFDVFRNISRIANLLNTRVHAISRALDCVVDDFAEDFVLSAEDISDLLRGCVYVQVKASELGSALDALQGSAPEAGLESGDDRGGAQASG